MFGTYVDEPKAGHEGMAIGLCEFDNDRHVSLTWMLSANPSILRGSPNSWRKWARWARGDRPLPTSLCSALRWSSLICESDRVQNHFRKNEISSVIWPTG